MPSGNFRLLKMLCLIGCVALAGAPTQVCAESTNVPSTSAPLSLTEIDHYFVTQFQKHEAHKKPISKRIFRFYSAGSKFFEFKARHA